MSSIAPRRRATRAALAGLASIGIAVALGGGSSALPASGTDAVTQNDPHEVTTSPGNVHGSIASPRGTVAFDSRSIGNAALPEGGPGPKLYDRPVQTSITVNGDEITLEMNPGTGTLDMHSPAGTLVSGEDKGALAAASTHLSQELVRPGHLPTNEQAFVLRNLSYLAEAPAGLPFPTTITQVPKMPALFASCTHEGQAPAGHAAPEADDGAPQAIALLPCNVGTVVTGHDAGRYHNYQEFTIRGGPSSGNTTGMCGREGDPGGSGGWTRDCLDHDFCVQHDNAVPGTPVGVCGDEFNAASDDYTSTGYCQCQGGAVCPPGYPPPAALGRSSPVPSPDKRGEATATPHPV